MVLALSSVSTQYLIIGAAAFVILASFTALLLAPALVSFGRLWEKVAAFLLSVYILVALTAAGVGIGLVLVYYWDSIVDLV